MTGTVHEFLLTREPDLVTELSAIDAKRLGARHREGFIFDGSNEAAGALVVL